MVRYHRITWAVISGLILLCGFGPRVYAADSCLTEVLPEDTRAHVVFTDTTLDYQMKKGEALTAIPQESVNEEGTALAKDVAFTLPTTKPEGNHRL